MQLTTNASCDQVPPGTANTFRRNTFGCSLESNDQNLWMSLGEAA